MRLQPGVAFGAYTVLDEIGRGGMAVVYEAEHRGLKKRVALKVLHTPSEPSAQRFLREGMASARVHHEHIVDVLDTGVHEGTAYLVMERLQGESLADRLRRDGPLEADRIADLLLPVVSALAAAHEADVVHRDIKPENIYLARSRRDEVVPKVLDFGLARLHTVDGDAQRLTGSAALLGTVTHLAPEQVLDPETASAASDQYALGVVLYECATGKLPVQGPSVFATLNAVLKGRYAKPRALAPALDPRLDALIVRAMARAPGDRFPDVRALGAALLPLASDPSREAWAREFGASSGAPSGAPRDVSAVTAVRVLTGRSASLRALPLGLAALVGVALWSGLRREDTPRGPRAIAPAATAVAAPVVAPVAAPVVAPVAPAPPAPPAPVVVAPPAPVVVAPPAPAAAPTRPLPARRGLPATAARRPVAPAPAITPAPATTPAPAPPAEPAVPWALRTRYREPAVP